MKKLHRGDGKAYTFISRQALRYAIVSKLHEERNWELAPVTEEKKVKQFKEIDTIKYPEIDLFGYMTTEAAAVTRSAVCRITHAVSMEPFQHDMSFNANQWMAKRVPTIDIDLWQQEEHLSFYKYSLTKEQEIMSTCVKCMPP